MDSVRRLLETLVGMDTTSARSNLDLLAFVESLLDQHGVPHERVPSPDGRKANLLALIGPDVEGGVVLTGHTDCVPVVGQPWSRDPFVVDEMERRRPAVSTCSASSSGRLFGLLHGGDRRGLPTGGPRV